MRRVFIFFNFLKTGLKTGLSPKSGFDPLVDSFDFLKIEVLSD